MDSPGIVVGGKKCGKHHLVGLVVVMDFQFLADEGGIEFALPEVAVLKHSPAEGKSGLGALDPRSRDIAKAVVKILQAAGVNFAVLGEMELCCGDPDQKAGMYPYLLPLQLQIS